MNQDQLYVTGLWLQTTGYGIWKTEAFAQSNNFLPHQLDLPLSVSLALRVGNEQDVGLSDANPLLPFAAGVAEGVKFLRSRNL